MFNSGAHFWSPVKCHLQTLLKPLVSDFQFASIQRGYCYYYSTTPFARAMSSGDYEVVDVCDDNFDPDPEDSGDFSLNPWWVVSNYLFFSPFN